MIVPTDHDQAASDTPFTHQLCVWLPRAGVYKIVFRVLNSRGILSHLSSPEIYFVKVSVGLEMHVSYVLYTRKTLCEYSHACTNTCPQQEGPKSPDGMILLNDQRKTQQYVRSQGVDATWKSFSDSTAGIFRYEYFVIAGDSGSNFSHHAPALAISPVVNFLLDRNEVWHARTFQFNLLARNFANAVSRISTSEIIFDLQPPQCR